MSKVENGNTVKVHYTGKFEDGSVFDSSVTNNEPITFQVGGKQVIPGFENAIVGMTVGESKTVTLTPEDAYGQPIDGMVQEVPKELVPADVQVGAQLISESEQGTFNVVVREIKENSVVLDANHPLAGKTLVFDLELVDIA
jgi:FKBP-type peptidyl-prolyl cis-trans isomerase 2